MNAKIANFTEMSKLLSEKRDINSNLLALFTKFGLGRLLCRLSMEKHDGISAVQLILSLCLFRINKETIHSIYKKKFWVSGFFRLGNRLIKNKILPLSHETRRTSTCHPSRCAD